MIKDFFQYFMSLGEVQRFEIDKIEYTDKQLVALRPPALAGLGTETLRGLVDYFNMLQRKSPDEAEKLMVHIEHPRRVCLLIWHGDNQTKIRQIHIYAELKNNDFPYDSFMPQETFIINLNAFFVQNKELLDMIKKTSLITTVNEASEDDDGTGQNVVIRSGVSLNRVIEQKSIIKLNPITTFNEVAQPEDEFVFRVRKAPATMALFKTQNSGVGRIGVGNLKAWLRANLPKDIPIIA